MHRKIPLAAHCLTRYTELPDNKGICLAGCKTMETVEHPMSCSMYTQIRNEVFGHDNVIKDLNSELKKMLKFLKKIKRDTTLFSNSQCGELSTRWGYRWGSAAWPLPSLGTGSADDEEEGELTSLTHLVKELGAYNFQNHFLMRCLST